MRHTHMLLSVFIARRKRSGVRRGAMLLDVFTPLMPSHYAIDVFREVIYFRRHVFHYVFLSRRCRFSAFAAAAFAEFRCCHAATLPLPPLCFSDAFAFHLVSIIFRPLRHCIYLAFIFSPIIHRRHCRQPRQPADATDSQIRQADVYAAASHFQQLFSHASDISHC